MKKKAIASLTSGEEPDEAEGALKTFHSRTFPDGAFIPGSVRAINPRRSDVAILNALLGVRPPERFPKEVLKELTQNGFTGDSAARERFERFVAEVWFPPNRGRMGNVGQEVLVSHIRLGAAFRPKQHYGADRWAVAILRTGGLADDADAKQILREVVEKAQRRPTNLVEKALLDSLGAGEAAPADDRPPTLPMKDLNVALCRVVKGLLLQSRWPDSSHDDAERIVLDVVAVLRTGMYLNWILMHEQAFQAVQAFRRREPFVGGTPRLTFGMSKEKRAGVGRSFHATQTHLEMSLEEGSFAILALSQLHGVMGWKIAKWVDELAGPAGEKAAPPDLTAWFRDYSEAMKAEGVGAPYLPSETPSSIRGAFCEMQLTISRNFRLWRPKDNTRFSHRSTLGAITSMALAEGGALFAPHSGNKKHLPLVDLDLYLLVGRAFMSAANRTTARVRILHELDNIGIRLDDETVAAIETELERAGRLRKLSDAGESLYVRVD